MTQQISPTGHQLTRRQLLATGVAGSVGGLANRGVAESNNQVISGLGSGPARNVILLFLHGGAATQDMYDMKPHGPSTSRSEFDVISTSAPGIHVCEHLPLMSRWMHRSAVIRSVSHQSGCHNTVPAFSGHEGLVPNQLSEDINHPPSMGSIVEYCHQNKPENRGRGVLPTYFCLPHHLGWGANETRPGIYSGWLGKQFDPLCSQPVAWYEKDAVLHDWQNIPTTMGYPRLSNEKTVSRRLNQRWDLRTALDRGLGQHVDKDSGVTKFNRRHEQAFELLTTNRVRGAFDLTRESEKTRELYGPSLFGNSCLVARRLVQAGMQFINVFWDGYPIRPGSYDYGWDTHGYNFEVLRERNLPGLDQSVHALLTDLERHGMLEETLLLITSDFGRTPNINQISGRDHWTHCYSNLMFGAGIQGGSEYGASDQNAAYVKSNPVHPRDVCATVLKAMGISENTMIYDRLDRPRPVAMGGKPINRILS
ncbi:MAG: DUF1501 domain-containing protein [Pirellulaceae bacterium]|nr:DUF1501 domain-containing protein [Pirellulaceae bacterium]